MFRRIIAVSAFAVGFATLGAQASELSSGQLPIPARAAAQGVMLAQQGDVEIYVDEYGRRVIVDAYTGEVIAIQPRSVQRRELRRQPRHTRQERYYLDDPEDMERLRQDRMRDWAACRVRRRSTNMKIFRAGSSPSRRRTHPRRSFPDEPDDFQIDPDQPEIVTREPIERAPLDDYSIVNPEISEPPSIIEEPAPSHR